MATTIQIKEETKKALFLKKNEIERESNKKITYDELVMNLLSKIEKMEKIEPKKSLEELIGTISKDEIELYGNLRQEYQNE